MPKTTLSDSEEQKLAEELRNNLSSCQKTDRENRDAYRDNMKMLGGEQWEPLEAQRRRNKRLMLSGDQLNGPVDQVVNSVKQNKPGPQVSPSGEGTDKIDAQVMEGILRRIDYENRAWICFGDAMYNACGGNFGAWAVDIEYRSDRSFQRVIKYRNIPNANETVYFDSAAIEKDRSDSTWAMEIIRIPWSTYRVRFGKKHNGTASQVAQQAWPGGKGGLFNGIFSFFQSFSDDSIKGWYSEDGIQLARYWKVKLETATLTQYDNGIAYFDDERDKIPSGAKPDPTQPIRTVERRRLYWYLMNAVEVLQWDEWPGYWIPIIPVYGRERWVEGKRVLQSMIQLAKQAQQAFNYAFTGACEVLATASKTPYIGFIGQFKSKYNQWKTANTENHAYLEADLIEIPGGGYVTQLPQRNQSEPPVQSFLAFCNLCSIIIQRATSVFDPSLGKQKSDQSGKAIQELQQESNQGNFHWSDNLTIALTHNYRVIGDLVQQEYDAPQVTQIMRAGSNVAESTRINQTFISGKDENGQDVKRKHNIAHGSFAYTMAVGQSYDSEMLANSQKISQFMRFLPPQLVAQCADILVKLQNYGPLGDELADRLAPPAFRDPKDPQTQAQNLAQAMQQNSALTQAVQKLKWALDTKQAEGEVKKWVAAVGAMAEIESMKIKVGDNQADREQSMIETAVGFAHDAASDHADRLHKTDLANLNSQTQLAQAQMSQQQPPTGQEPQPGA